MQTHNTYDLKACLHHVCDVSHKCKAEGMTSNENVSVSLVSESRYQYYT